MNEAPKLFCTEEQFEFIKQQEFERTRIINAQREETIIVQQQLLAAFIESQQPLLQPSRWTRPPMYAQSSDMYLRRKVKVK